MRPILMHRFTLSEPVARLSGSLRLKISGQSRLARSRLRPGEPALTLNHAG
jgi:hypothetical protein